VTAWSTKKEREASRTRRCDGADAKPFEAHVKPQASSVWGAQLMSGTPRTINSHESLLPRPRQCANRGSSLSEWLLLAYQSMPDHP
jgi:hypothetical protein